MNTTPLKAPVKKEAPFISVVIATYNRTDSLIDCVNSVTSGAYDNFEIIIVGQGDDDKTKAKITEMSINEERIRYCHTNIVGLSNARNVGCEKAKGDIVVFIDDDAIASDEWLSAYGTAFSKMTPTPAMVGGKLLPKWEIPCPQWYPEERKFILGLYDIGNEIQKYPESDLPPGANFAVLRKVIMKLGGFDKRLGFDEGRKSSMIAGEDSLMALKVKDSGYSIYYQPKAAVFHKIASYKLTRTYFLKRHFWEGITIVNIINIRNCPGRTELLSMLLHHSLKILKACGVFLFNIIKISPNRSTRQMQYLGSIFYSLGVCSQTGKIVFRKAPCS